MPPGEDWALQCAEELNPPPSIDLDFLPAYASRRHARARSGPYADRSLVRNALAMWLARGEPATLSHKT